MQTKQKKQCKFRNNENNENKTMCAFVRNVIKYNRTKIDYKINHEYMIYITTSYDITNHEHTQKYMKLIYD